MQFATGMRSALCQCHFLCWTFEQAVIASLSIDLQGAAEAFQVSFCMLNGAPRRIGKGITGWVIAVPRLVIAGEGSEVAGLCAFPLRCENRRGCLIHEELG